MKFQTVAAKFTSKDGFDFSENTPLFGRDPLILVLHLEPTHLSTVTICVPGGHVLWDLDVHPAMWMRARFGIECEFPKKFDRALARGVMQASGAGQLAAAVMCSTLSWHSSFDRLSEAIASVVDPFMLARRALGFVVLRDQVPGLLVAIAAAAEAQGAGQCFKVAHDDECFTYFSDPAGSLEADAFVASPASLTPARARAVVDAEADSRFSNFSTVPPVLSVAAGLRFTDLDRRAASEMDWEAIASLRVRYMLDASPVYNLDAAYSDLGSDAWAGIVPDELRDEWRSKLRQEADRRARYIGLDWLAGTS